MQSGHGSQRVLPRVLCEGPWHLHRSFIAAGSLCAGALSDSALPRAARQTCHYTLPTTEPRSSALIQRASLIAHRRIGLSSADFVLIRTVRVRWLTYMGKLPAYSDHTGRFANATSEYRPLRYKTVLQFRSASKRQLCKLIYPRSNPEDS